MGGVVALRHQSLGGAMLGGRAPAPTRRIAPRTTGAVHVVGMMQPRKIPRRIKRPRPEFVYFEGCRSNGRAYIKEGNWALVAKDPCWLTGNAIEACRKVLVQMMRQGGKNPANRVIVRVEVRWPITRRTEGTRMGGGKGALDHWVAPVKRDEVLFEVVGFEGRPDLQRRALKTCESSLPCRCGMIVRNTPEEELNLDHIDAGEIRDDLDVALEQANEEIKRAKIKKFKKEFRF